ncbi:MAG: SAM-dependent methyltransferase [bacterium]
MAHRHFRIASRDSRLARTQSQEALDAIKPIFPAGTEFEFVFLQSPGDRDQRISLTDPTVPDDFFTRDIDAALREGKADFAIHSAKDLPKSMPADLAVAAVLPARDIRDALVLRLARRASPTLQPQDPEGRDGATPSAWQAPRLPRSERGRPRVEDSIKVIGTSSPKREEEIRKLFPNVQLKPLRGTIDQRIEKLDSGEYDAIIVAACALERLDLAARINEYLPYDPAPGQGRLAITTRADATELLAILKKADVRRTAGLVAILGCPADASLLPVRTQQYLKHADVIFHDRLIPDGVLRGIRGKAISVGKAGGHPSIGQAEIHWKMLREAEQGKLVARLHGGDAGIYGHLGEELEFLTAWNIRVDIVTAPTAAQVAAAHANTPLTHRGDGHRLTILSAHNGVEGLGRVPLPGEGNLAVYMGSAQMKYLASQLMDLGWAADTPVICGERLGYRDERITRTTLSHITSLVAETPAVFLVGTRAFPETPCTLFVGTDPEHFIKYGPLIHWPLIKLVSRPIKDRVAELKKHIDDVRGVIFPSRFAVESFIEALMHGSDVRALAGKVLLAVGPATEEEMARVGLRADGAADTYGGVHALAKKLKKDFTGKYLYPCSDASPVGQRVADLKAHGIELIPSNFYMNREMPYADLPRRPFARVLFTSTSTVNTYFTAYPAELKANRTWLAVGPSTLKALESRGLAAECID